MGGSAGAEGSFGNEYAGCSLVSSSGCVIAQRAPVAGLKKLNAGEPQVRRRSLIEVDAA